jgi:putative redox protein
MHIADLEYLGGLRNSAVHLRSGNTIITDAPLDNNGKGEAFSPTDLLSTSLAACMMTIMGIAAERMELDLSGTKVAVSKVMAADPRRVAEVHVTFEMPKRNYSEKERIMLERAAHTCPVALSLHPDLNQVVIFNW